MPGQAKSTLDGGQVSPRAQNRQEPHRRYPSYRRFRANGQIDMLYRMQQGIIRSFLLALALSASSAPLLAHHSFAAEYDDQKPIKVTGVITKVEWQNPHIWFYVDVKGDDGKVTNYAFSGGAPGQLMRRGVMKSSLVVGATITVD